MIIALGHQSGAKGHHQRLNAEQSDADAVDRSDNQPKAEPDRNGRNSAELERRRRHQERRAHGYADDREIDPSGQHDHGLTGGENAQGRREQERIRQPYRIDCAGLQDFDGGDKQQEQEDEGDNIVALKPVKNACGTRCARSAADAGGALIWRSSSKRSGRPP